MRGPHKTLCNMVKPLLFDFYLTASVYLYKYIHSFNMLRINMCTHIYIQVIVTLEYLKGQSGEMQGGSKMGSNDAY
jgi:hypothetical protein